MAEREEIEISQLELAEDLAPDWVMPVEGATKTWATTLEKIRQFFGLDNKTNLNMDNLNADGKSLISGLVMPSSKHINLTLGASGATYTAPVNGWLAMRKAATNAKQYMVLYNANTNIINNPQAVDEGATIDAIVDVKKGDVVKVDYTLGGSTEYFRFIYAEGEK